MQSRAEDMQTNQKELMGALAAITSAILFGTMPFMAKYAFRLGSNAFTVSFGRFLTGAVLSFLLLLLLPEQSPRISPEQLRSLLLLSFFYAATPVLLYSSYQSIDSGLASTLHFTYPVAVVLLSALLLHEKIGRKESLCTVLCMCGMIPLSIYGWTIERGRCPQPSPAHRLATIAPREFNTVSLSM
jgi:drug/metabolite transporter (DMT)-like permease